MQSKWFVLAVLLASCRIFAATADQFDCKYTVEKDNHVVAAGDVQPWVARVPTIPISPGPSEIPWTQTEASWKMDVFFQEAERGELSLNMSYMHAMQNSPGVAGAQYLCMTISLGVDGVFESNACLSPTQDPWAINSDWSPVAIENGVPAFDTNALKMQSAAITTINAGYTAHINCHYLGTVP